MDNKATMAFASGDLVLLKSGGPVMTVKQPLPTPAGPSKSIFVCQWFGGKKLESGQFHADSIRQATPEEVATGQKK